MDELTALLSGRCNPQLAELYLALNQQLELCGLQDYDIELTMLYGVEDQVDPLSILPTVDTIFRTAAGIALNRIGVSVDGEIPLDMLVEIVRILVNFDPTDTPQVLLDVLNGDEDDLETLLELLEQQSRFSSDDFFPYVLSVKPELIKAARTVCEAAVETRQAVPDSGALAMNREIVRRFNVWKQQDPAAVGMQLGAEGVGLGMSMESLYVCRVGDLLDATEPDMVGHLISLAAISCESLATHKAKIEECLDDLCPDVMSRQRAQQHLTQRYPAYLALMESLQ